MRQRKSTATRGVAKEKSSDKTRSRAKEKSSDEQYCNGGATHGAGKLRK